jgi:hypothetical protein
MGPRRQSIEFSRLSVRLVGTGERKPSPGRLVRLPVHFRCLYATAVRERPSGLRVEPNSRKGAGAHCGSVRVRTLTGQVSMCQRLRWVSRLRVGCSRMTSLLGSAVPAGLVLAFSVAHCRFGGE